MPLLQATAAQRVEEANAANRHRAAEELEARNRDAARAAARLQNASDQVRIETIAQHLSPGRLKVCERAL